MRSTEPVPRSFLRRWGRRLFGIAVLGMLCFLFRASILRSAGRSLIADDGFVPCSRVTPLSGDRRYDATAGLLKSGRAEGVLIIPNWTKRIQKLGLMLTDEATDRRELARRGIAGDRIEVIPGEAATLWDRARILSGWLDRHPDSTVLVLTERFKSRHDRLILRHCLSADEFARVRIAALPHRDYNESDWWRQKGGGLAFGYGVLNLAYVVLAGEDEPVAAEPTPDELEGAGR